MAVDTSGGEPAPQQQTPQQPSAEPTATEVAAPTPPRQQAPRPAGATPPPPPAPPALGALRRLLDAELFPRHRTAPPTWRRVLLGAVAVVLATALSLARTRGPGALNSIWAEDGRNFLADALNKPVVDALTTPFNGYWHTGPRLLAEVASRFPIEWAPAVLSTEAALVTSVLALVVYLASGAYLGHPALRLLAAVPAALAPAGVGWVENNVATLQFPLLYGLFWALLWVPNTIWGRLTATGVVLFAAFSTPLAVVFVPLALTRLVLRRDWLAWALGGGLAAGIALQLGGAVAGWTDWARIGAPRYDPLWALGDYLGKLLPTAIFGEKWTFDRMEQGVCPLFVVTHTGEHRVLVVASWMVLAAAVFVGARRCRPAWALVAVALAHSVALYSGSIMTLGCPANRYFVAPSLLVLTAVAALLRPKTPDEAPDGAPAADRAKARLTTAAVVFLTLATVVCVANLRGDSPRSSSPRWSDLVRTARQQCVDERRSSVVITTTVPNWTMQVRCSALRDHGRLPTESGR